MNIALKSVAIGLLLAISSAVALAATTIAVVPLGAEASKFGDILTVELSKLPSVTLLERDQINKLLNEQAFAATQQKDFIKLGRMLNAEGLMVLERRVAQGTNEIVAARLIAVRPGVVIAEEHFALPLTEPLKWAESYATQLERVLPKLAVNAADALPVSVGSLRSSVSTGDGVVLEQELTTLLRLRLAHEPSVFLLERRNMEALQIEKEIAGTEQPFWNGAMVVDGTINRDTVSQRDVTIDARIAMPARAPAEVRVSGRRDDLPSLVNDLVLKILTTAGKKGSLTPWQTAIEAEKFFQEAQWAARWRLWQQTREAADASWALGKRDPLVGGHRVVSRAWLALSMRGYFGWDPPDAFGFHQPPSPEVLPTVASMFEIYEQGWRTFSVGTNSIDGGWISLGIALLPVSARVLDQYYQNVEYRAGHEEELRRVRALARQHNQSLITNGSRWPLRWQYDFKGIPAIYSHTKNGPVQSLLNAWFDSEGVWFDSPHDAIAFYRQSRSSDVPWFIQLLGPRPQIPLAGWSVKDREQLPSVWTEFLQEMMASTNLHTRLNGMRLILLHSDDPELLASTAERFVEEVSRNDRSIWGLTDVSVRLTNLLVRMDRWGVPQSKKVESLRDAASLLGSQLSASTQPKALSNQVSVSREAKTMVSDVPAVTVSRVWRQEEQELPGGRIFHYRWSLREMFWQDNHLWMAAQTHGTKFQGAEPKVAFLKFDLATMRPEVIESPLELLLPSTYRRMLVASQELFVVSSNAVWRRDVTGGWKQFPVPVSGVPLLWGKNIVLRTAESIVQLSLETGEVRVLASMRRNPPASALDRMNLDGAAIAVWPSNTLCVVASGQIWKFDPKQNDWRAFITATNCGESLQLEPQGVFYRQSGECGGPRIFGGWRPGIASLECYTWIPTMRTAQITPELITPPLWTCSTQSVSYNRVAQFDGANIWIFPTLFSRKQYHHELSPPTLLFLDPRLDQALEIDMTFAASLSDDAKAYKETPPIFLPTPEGLAIQTDAPGRLLWVPKADLQSALAKARQQQNARESTQAAALIRFDRNGDGWLDDSERRMMRQDGAWQRELSARIASARAEALRKHSAEWDRLFDAGDKNRDGKLTTFEFRNLVAIQPSVLLERLRGNNSQPFFVTRPYDLNNDGALARDEFKEFMSDPRLPSEVNRSASWVTKFGLKVEACDTNDDGVLDSAERAQTLRLLRQKSGRAPGEQN